MSRLKLSGEGIGGGVAGQECSVLVTTFDATGRRRGTRGDPFACALRMPGALEEGAEERLVSPERRCRDNGDGTHELVYVSERAGHFTCVIRLGGATVKELDVTIVAAPTDAKTSQLSISNRMERGVPTVKAGDTVPPP